MVWKQWFTNGFIYLLILVGVAALFFNIFAPPPRSRPFISISQLVSDAKSDLISRIVVQGSDGDLLVTYWDEPGTQYASRVERDESVTRLLQDAGVDLDNIRIVSSPSSSWEDILAILAWLLPVIVVAALIFFLFRQAGSGNQVAKNLVKHTWQIDRKPTITFADVGGMREAKEAVGDIIAYLKDPGRFGELGERMPRAVLVQGPPGVGKDLIVQAVAGEARSKLITANSSEFVELFAGVAAARVRDLFEEAKKLAPVVVFIDQLDAVGRRRRELGKDMNASEQELFLSQLFAELDTLKSKRGIVVFTATNRPELLDPALLRAGRLERQINIGVPTEEERLEILKILVRGKPLAQDVKLEEIARETPGRTGADLESIVNQATVNALKGGAAKSGGAITHDDLKRVESTLKTST